MKQESAQFGLRYLLTFTAIVGVLLVLVKHSLPADGLGNNMPQWRELVAVMSVFMVFSTLICLPCVWLALSDGRQFIWLIWLAVAGLAGPFIVFAVVSSVVGRPPKSADVIASIFCFELGAAGTMLLVLMIFRSLGYRLIRPILQSPISQPGQATPNVRSIEL